MLAATEPLGERKNPGVWPTYTQRHPRLARSMTRVCGLEIDGSAEDYQRIGRERAPRPSPPLGTERAGGAVAAPGKRLQSVLAFRGVGRVFLQPRAA